MMIDCKEWNKLYDEKKDLEFKFNALKGDYNRCKFRLENIEKENEQLKQQVESLKNDLKFGNFLDCITGAEDITELAKENNQLKETMKKVAELLSDEVDLFSDKAIEHDINAYVELNELDNKDAYYMAKATKTAIKMLKGDVE